MASSMDQAIDLRYYARVLWLRKGIILLCTITVICTTIIAVALMPDIYESGITVLMEKRRPLGTDLDHMLGERVRPIGFREEERQLAELSTRILSRPFLERVIRRLQMEQDPGVRAKAAEMARDHTDIPVEEMAIRLLVNKLRAGIRIGAKDGTFSIVVAEYSARNAFYLAQWVGQVLIETRKQNSLELMESAQEFGMQHLRFYEQHVQAAEDSVEIFKSSMIKRELERSVVGSENLELANILGQRIQGDLLESQSRVSQLGPSENLIGPAEMLQGDPNVQSLDTRIRAVLNGAIVDRLGITNPNEPITWPPQGIYATLRRELLQRLQTLSAQRGSSDVDPEPSAIATYAFLQMDVDAKSAAALSLGEFVQDFKQRAQSQPVDEMELARLEKEVAMYRQLLEMFRAQKVAAELTQSVELTSLGEHVDIVSPAQLPLKPSRPNKVKLLLAAFILGPALGVAAAFLALLLDPTSRSLEEFGRVVPEPILGTVPLMSTLAPRHRGIRRYWVPAAVTSVILLTAAFFAFKSNVQSDLANLGRPVQIVEPEAVTPQ